MNNLTWKEAITRETERLAAVGRLPDLLHGHPALRAMGFVCTLALAPLETQLIANSVEVRIVSKGLQSPDRETRSILRLLQEAVASPAKGERGASVSPAEWINRHDYDGFIASTIDVALPDSDRANLLHEVSRALAKVTSALHTAQDAHLGAIANRDVPPLARGIAKFIPSRVRWLLAVDHDGRPERPQALIRRTQAFTTYAAVADALTEGPVTAAIDAGKPLAPILAEQLGVSRAGVRALAGCRT